MLIDVISDVILVPMETAVNLLIQLMVCCKDYLMSVYPSFFTLFILTNCPTNL